MDEFESIIPVKPPVVKRIIKPTVHHKEGCILNVIAPESVLNHEKTFTPVGIAIIIVADVK
jgi:hypothetical protein